MSGKSPSPVTAGIAPADSPPPAIAVRDDEIDSAIGDDVTLSTASLANSVEQYRTIEGRRFHSDRYVTAQKFTPNDDRQQESIDLCHQGLTMMLNRRLFLAPIPDDVKKVIDIGTGTGVWAIDFADLYPHAEVIGTDLSPIQPAWVPPNLKFEIDDATQPWTWEEGRFDFIHLRYLIGSISDWNELFAQSYRSCTPGGWVESCELETEYHSDDGTAPPVYKELCEMYAEAGAKTGRSFRVVEEGLQRKGLEAAGFTHIEERSIKVPLGNWPADPKLAEIGQYCQLAVEIDIEGYTLYMCRTVLGWDLERYQMFLLQIRQGLKNKRAHCYVGVKYVWGQKPAAE